MNIKTVGCVHRRLGKNVGDLSSIGVCGSVTDLIKGQGRGGGYYREKSGVGVGNKLGF